MSNKTIKIAAEIDEAELALRIAEVCCGVVRKEGVEAREVIKHIESLGPLEARSMGDFKKAAKVCASYFAECLEKASTVQ